MTTGRALKRKKEEVQNPVLVRRAEDRAILERANDAGLSAPVARVLARRELPETMSIAEFLTGAISCLDDPYRLKGMRLASERVAQAVIDGERIGLESDYDQDGLGAMATMRLAFLQTFNHPPGRLASYVGHRLRDGYGLSPAVADRILAEETPPSVLLTADNGSSDEAQIRRLAEGGIDCIITDHHAIPSAGTPKSAYACINPQQDGCDYPDRAIAGGMVAWLLMCAVRRTLIEKQYLEDGRNTLADLLDFVACSTVADCVSMASLNNRALVKFGLKLINQMSRPCWQGLAPLIKTQTITAQTIAFGIAPRVNAQTRMSSAQDALNFLLAENVEEATHYAGILDNHNEERKATEREMVEQAIAIGEKQAKDNRVSMVVFLAEGHPGVQGICSSRMVDYYGRPTFTFCPDITDGEMMTGSGRSIGDVQIRDALQAVDDRHPGLLRKFGGHAAAAGASMKKSKLERFAEAFEEAVSAQLGSAVPGPMLESDGPLAENELTMETWQEFQVLEPTGRGFEGPQFDGEFEILRVRPVGDGTHLKLVLRYGSTVINGIWFKAIRGKSERVPIHEGETALLVYNLMVNNFRGNSKLEIQVVGRC